MLPSVHGNLVRIQFDWNSVWLKFSSNDIGVMKSFRLKLFEMILARMLLVRLREQVLSVWFQEAQPRTRIPRALSRHGRILCRSMLCQCELDSLTAWNVVWQSLGVLRQVKGSGFASLSHEYNLFEYDFQDVVYLIKDYIRTNDTLPAFSVTRLKSLCDTSSKL